MELIDVSSNGDARWLAVDFGTCYSSAARWVDGRAVAVKEPLEHRFSVPSSVLLAGSGELLVGFAAERRKVARPAHYAEEFKREVGRPAPLPLGDREVAVEELIAAVVGLLKREAEQVAGELPRGVLTVPASYEGHKREVMERAAAAAGFASAELLEEPVAASLARPAREKDEELLLVYDLGGGTFDAALVRLAGDEHQVLGFDGLGEVGGSNFDRAVESDLTEVAGDELADALAGLAADPGSKEYLAAKRMELAAREFCEQIKRDLSTAQDVENALLLPGGAVIDYRLSRDRLARLIEEDLARTVRCCAELVERSEPDWDDVDAILLVGGSCRLPFVSEHLEREFGRPIQRVEDPELAVCLGAAAWAHRAEERERERAEEARRHAERERQEEQRAAEKAREQTPARTATAEPESAGFEPAEVVRGRPAPSVGAAREPQADKPAATPAGGSEKAAPSTRKVLAPATLEVVRQKRTVAFALGLNVAVDGRKVGKLGNGTSLTTELPAGRHTVEVSAMGTPSTGIHVECHAGERIRIECAPKLSGGWTVQRRGQAGGPSPGGAPGAAPAAAAPPAMKVTGEGGEVAVGPTAVTLRKRMNRFASWKPERVFPLAEIGAVHLKEASGWTDGFLQLCVKGQPQARVSVWKAVRQESCVTFKPKDNAAFQKAKRAIDAHLGPA